MSEQKQGEKILAVPNGKSAEETKADMAGNPIQERFAGRVGGKARGDCEMSEADGRATMPRTAFYQVGGNVFVKLRIPHDMDIKTVMKQIVDTRKEHSGFTVLPQGVQGDLVSGS